MGAVVLALGAWAFAVFLWSGPIGPLIRLLCFSGRRLAPPQPIAIPLVVVGYTLYRNGIPYPTGLARRFPVVGRIWPAAARPGVARLAVSAAGRPAPDLEEDLA